MKQDRNLSYKDISRYRSGIMGISIIGILFCHLAECQLKHGSDSSLLANLLVKGTAFVDVFMIVSGIGLYFSFINNNNLIQFYKKRFFRLIPTYLIVTVPYWIYRDILLGGLGITDVLKDVFFVSFIFDGRKTFWFIFAILVCYTLFPVIYRYIYRTTNITRNALTLILISVIVSIAFMFYLPQTHTNLQIMLDRIPAFIFGVYLGEKSLKDVQISKMSIIGVSILCLVTQFIMHWDTSKKIYMYAGYYISIILGLFLLVITISFFKLLKSSVLESILNWFGTITMELYIWHSLIKQVFDFPASTVMYILLVVVLPIPCAYFSHVLIQKLLSIGRVHESI